MGKAARVRRRRQVRQSELAVRIAEIGGLALAGVAQEPDAGVHGGRAGCPLVPRDFVPVHELMRRPRAVLLGGRDLGPGVLGAVRWWCRDGCGQDHVTVYVPSGS